MKFPKGSSKGFLQKCYWLLAIQLGLDFRKCIQGILLLPRYIRDAWYFKRHYSGRIHYVPCLHDAKMNAGILQQEYFHQDLYVASKIYKANPFKHLDVGSSLDSFVAHLASFRQVDVADIRKMPLKIPNLSFKQMDFCSPFSNLGIKLGAYDSISCLHAIEHFGLGRYGDNIDPIAYEIALSNMVQLLRPGGILYLSTPVGIEIVEFNANRIFDPVKLKTFIESLNMNLIDFAYIDNGVILGDMNTIDSSLLRLCQLNYTLGIFTFRKSD